MTPWTTGHTPLDPETGQPEPPPDYLTLAEARAELAVLAEFEELFEELGLGACEPTES